MALTTYENQVARLLHDPNFQAYGQADVDAYINIARGQVAIEGECVRAMLSGGTITGFTINAPGTGYAGTLTVTITGSGSQAFASATQSGGAINAVTLNAAAANLTPAFGGWGFITGTTTTVAITGSGGGSGASIAATVDHSLETVTGQEVYYFNAWNTLAGNQTMFPGISQIIKVISIACSQSGTYKPMLTPMVFSEFQAYRRIYQNTVQNYPIYWSQYSYGVNGSVYLYPWPSQPLQLDVDACCIPIALASDSTIEVTPYPWTDAVPYYAAYLAYENSSRKEDADRLFKMYTLFMKRGRAYSETPFVPDYYSVLD